MEQVLLKMTVYNKEQTFNVEDHPHRRYNPLLDEWVLVSPHRAKRPWQGQVEDVPVEKKPAYDKTCYLCPNNERAGGFKNPDYNDTFVFDNDFSAMLPNTPKGEFEEDELFRIKSEKGICRVICFSPRHDLTIPEMTVSDIVKVVDVWQNEYRELGAHEFINYVQIFENKGSIMGCSNPHPHGQIWSQSSIPDIPLKECNSQRDYFLKHNKSLLLEYVEKEILKKERIVAVNEHFVSLVPFWAVWPFETMIISKRHFKDILQMRDDEKKSFAALYKELTGKYDRLFNISFPYSAGIHQSPTNNKNNDHWHFHMHFYPPLLRSASVKKFMVGYEMLANSQRDITPETSAKMLRDL
jgi:UDPglucose--hexose-1-phosphate uridylyltransferase